MDPEPQGRDYDVDVLPAAEHFIDIYFLHFGQFLSFCINHCLLHKNLWGLRAAFICEY